MKRLVLLGGGHAHVFVLDAFARRPLSGVELTMVAPYPRQVYSGMLPGWIAGHYPLDACTISLETLASRAGCRRHGTAGIGLDTERREVLCADGSRIGYDLLSIGVGSTTALDGITGVENFALPVRPIEAFIRGWEHILDEARAAGGTTLALLGGGAAGVELALSMQYRLNRDIDGGRVSLHLVSGSPDLLPGHPSGIGKRLTRLLLERGIQPWLGKQAVAVAPGEVRLAGGESIAACHTIAATGAAAPSWLRTSGLALDGLGFIRTDAQLRSVSHPDIFAAGDIAAMAGQDHPKSGVYAVRAGPPLAENLRRAVSGLPLLAHKPQRRALYLISTGGRHALASWGPLHWEGDWVWRWKDRIDRGFIARFQAGPAAE